MRLVDLAVWRKVQNSSRIHSWGKNERVTGIDGCRYVHLLHTHLRELRQMHNLTLRKLVHHLKSLRSDR